VSSHVAAQPAALRRAGAWIGVARDRVAAVRPLYALSALLVVQWTALAALALTVRHNGWLYYMGGDQLWHYTGAYLLGHGQLAPTLVGVGWATILTPITWFAGPDLASALPAIVLLDALVLLPLALLCIYGIAERIGGRLFGYWAAALWIALPYAGIPYALAGYHQKYTELTLPQILGLGAMSDFPSVVGLLVGAYLCLRAVDGGHWLWPAGAGFAVGYALAIKPSNAVFLVAPTLLFLLWRRAAVTPFALGLVPPLVVLAAWKVRGYGHLPAFAHSEPPPHRLSAGLGDIFTPFHKYTHDNTWTQLHNNLIQLREHLWSDRILEFLPPAGVVALLLRSRRAGVFVGAWFTVFLLLKGTYVNARVEDGGFWRLLLPAFPAFVLLVASIPLLLPGMRLRPSAPRPFRASRRTLVSALAACIAVLVLFPLALIAAATPTHLPDVAAVQVSSTLVPVSGSFALSATPEPNGILLSWQRRRPRTASVFYRVYRTPATGGQVCSTVQGASDCRPLRGDLACHTHKNAPDNCLLAGNAKLLGTTVEGAWLDRPPAGTWTYRVGLTANWLDDPQFGDVYVFSRAVTLNRS
jgi:hypothetical protein